MPRRRQVAASVNIEPSQTPSFTHHILYGGNELDRAAAQLRPLHEIVADAVFVGWPEIGGRHVIDVAADGGVGR